MKQEDIIRMAREAEFDSHGYIICNELAHLERFAALVAAAEHPWIGLTQQDIDIAFDDTQEGGGFNEFAHAIEAKLKEKNT